MIPRLHLFSIILILLASSALGGVMYFHLPAVVPTHWNWRGQADGYGPPWMDALLLPAIGWLIMSLLFVAPRLGPLRRNFARFARIYGRICVVIALAVLA